MFRPGSGRRVHARADCGQRTVHRGSRHPRSPSGPPPLRSSRRGAGRRLERRRRLDAPRATCGGNARLRGFFVVGFDVRAYLEGFTSSAGTLKPEDEPTDYKQLVERAARATHRKPTLVGVSEGAGLSVLAATDPGTRASITGVVGLGLPNMNELGWRWKDAAIYVTHGLPNEPTFSTRSIVNRMNPLPLAAIHSTHDEFVPVSEVEQVLSEATGPKRLWIVQASNHRFSDNLDEFDQRLLEAIDWVKQTCAALIAPVMFDRLRRWIPAALSLALFVVALEVLRVELRAVTWHELMADVVQTPPARLALAAILTVLNYVVLTGYDFLAFASIGKTLSRVRIAVGVVSRLRDCEQRRVRDAFRRVGSAIASTRAGE